MDTPANTPYVNVAPAPVDADADAAGPAVLAVGDVRAVVRLLAEVVDLPTGDDATRKRHLMCGLAEVVGADVWAWVQTLTPAPSDAPLAATVFSRLDGGWADDAQRVLSLRATESPDGRVLREPMFRQFAASPDGHLTRTRAQLLADPAWYGSDYYARHQSAMGLDDWLISTRRAGERVVSAKSFHRRVGREPFGPRERALVHVVVGEVDWLHRAGSALPAAGIVPGLSPRRREVLWLLLGGDGTKQIAAKLGLSVHTVGDHLKALYRHFAVASRGELAAKFLDGGNGPQV